MSTFISLGNALQKFERFAKMIVACDDLLPKPVMIQLGHNNFSNIPGNWNKFEFLSMEDFFEAIRSSEIIIIHGGAGSLINCVQAGKTPIVIPRLAEFDEHIDNHQIEFVSAMKDKGYILYAKNHSELRGHVKSLGRLGSKNNYSSKGINSAHSHLDNLLQAIALS